MHSERYKDMIVVHLTTVHPRYDGRIFLKECASLVKRFSVYVVVADGRGDETKNNIRILDIGSSKNRWHRIFFKTFAMLTKAFKLKADVYHLHDSELLPVGVVLKIFGKKVIYDAHENLSATVSYKQYIPIYLRGCVGFLVKNIEKLSVCFFDGLVAANQSIGNQFKLHKTYIVPNYTINNEFKESVAVKKKYGVKLCYVGGISEIRGICQLVDALYGTKVELILAGPFESDELKQRVMASAGWKNVDYRGTVSREEVCRIYSSSSAGVITFLPHPNHDACSPNKLYEYLSADRKSVV